MFTAHMDMDMDMDMDSQVKRKQLLYHELGVSQLRQHLHNDTFGSCQPTTLEKETLESVMS